MSLIHKALKKAEGGGAATPPNDPEEAFVGKGGGFFSSQFPPRTLILLVLALGAFTFLIYQKFIKKPSPPAESVAVTAPASTETTQVTQPPPAGPALAGPDRLEPTQPLGSGTQAAEEHLSPTVLPLVEEGKTLFAAGHYDEALAKFQTAAEAAPYEAVVWNNIGLVQKRKQNLAEAEKAYQKALELRPEYPEGLNNFGVLKAAQGDRLSAAIYLKKEGNLRSAIDAYKAFLQYTAATDKAFIEQVERRVEELSQ
ncbi:MAG: tetratricopeptide repeat protein [Deltaproteobacteria bacterium]|nr:tetratricopeptide repeat protein [Deltaproteobacteria bacterium]